MVGHRFLGVCCGLGLGLAAALLSSCAAHAPSAAPATSSAATAPPPAAAPVVPATTPHAPDGVNPFAGARLYGYPEFARTAEALAARTPAHAAALRKVASIPVAVWLDTIARAKRTSEWLDDALKQQTAGGKPVVPVFVVYDLPNRDCNAEASNGELSVKDAGEARYQQEYIDMIAAQFQAHASQRIVVVLEPDSLANVATNLANEKCAVAEQVYRRGISYAIAKLSLPNVFIYLDAAHAGWLGWPKNLKKSVGIYKDVLTAAGGAERIRGFAVNVSNYDSVKAEDRRRPDPSYPPADELLYVKDLADALADVGITNKGFIVDTSRNGRANVRTAPGNWCNIKGAGLGERPRAAPAPLVDAFVWIKVPGQSDGTANQSAARFDPNCASDDATPGAPEAGEWFEPYLVDLVKNANPPL
jgi:cellulose 1,4-beta-cellobiosidase